MSHARDSSEPNLCTRAEAPNQSRERPIRVAIAVAYARHQKSHQMTPLWVTICGARKYF